VYVCVCYNTYSTTAVSADICPFDTSFVLVNKLQRRIVLIFAVSLITALRGL